MMRKTWIPRCLKQALAVAAVLAITPASAFAQSVDAVESELEDLDSEISSLESSFLKPALLATQYKLEARYNDARVAYFQQDYPRASLLLVDVVRDPSFRSDADRREALYLLGDSLFRIRNYVAAQRYFERVLDMGPGKYYEETAGRLLQIAYETGNFDRLDPLYARLQGGQMSAEIAYLAAKAFYERGDYQKARDNFARAAQSEEYALVAEYFRGVSFVAGKQLEEAKRVFNGLVTQARPTETTRGYEIVDLSWLALGRIAYEESDVELAIDYYARLPRASPHFDRALWEQTWVLVSRGNFESARRNVDILQFLEDPDPDIAAEAKLLRADLSLKLGEYDTARADYEAVLDEYMPAKSEMDEFAAQHEDLSTFFATMTRDELATFESEYMPVMVQRWIESDPDMRASAALLKDVRRVEGGIRDSSRLLDELGAQLNSSARSQAFPALSEGVERGLAAEIELLELRRKLALEHYAAVSDQINGRKQKEWDRIVTDLEAMKARVSNLPETRKAEAERRDEVRAKLDQLEGELAQTGVELDALRAELQAADRELARNDGERPRLEKRRAILDEEVATLEEQRAALRDEVDNSRDALGDAGASGSVEAKLKQEYVQVLDGAESFLASVGTPPHVQAARSRLVAVGNHLDRYMKRLDEMVAEKVGGLREDLEVERKLLADHRASMRQLVNASQSGAGVLAYLNFVRARSEFSQIVLRGDVGIIDVSWRKKEDVTEKISDLFEDRTSELRLLQEAFEEVR